MCPLNQFAIKHFQVKGHQQEKGIIYNRTIKIQISVAVVTRQTKTRHGETLSD